MKKLSFEDGNVVVRNMDGTLHWNSHWADMKGSHDGDCREGGYKEILIEGILIENNDYAGEKRIGL